MLPTQTIENIKQGEELNHLAGLLFVRAASEWHWGVGLEMATGVMMVLLSELRVPHEPKLMLALLGFALFGIAYALRFSSEDTFDTAETMRRQSAFSEGLGWPVNSHQFAEWKSRAGLKVLNEFKHSTRPADYWDTRAEPGPRRLLELTIESSFWTRKLYKKLRHLLWLAFFVIIGIGLLIISASMMHESSSEGSAIASAVFIMLPALLIFDVLEWIFKINRVIDGIKEVEGDMDKLLEHDDLPESHVMRLVSEYSAIVSSGFPIHPLFYASWHDEIKELWEARK